MKFPFFFTRSKEIVIDCFTHLDYAYDNAKIDHGSKYLPEWWRTTPTAVPNISPELVSIKHCTGLIEYYKKGIVLPAWFTMDITINPIGADNAWEYVSSNQDVSTDSHFSNQFAGFAGNDGHNIKLVSPWTMKTKANLSFTWTEPLWSMPTTHQYISVLPAVVNYKYTHATEINLFVRQTKELQTCRIEPFSPLAIMHPMTENSIKLVHHLVSMQEWNRNFGIDKFIFRRRDVNDSTQIYRTKKKLVAEVDRRDQIGQKCPYHRGD